MSHRKYEHPRCGSLGFLPRKKTRKHRGKFRSFPKDNPALPPHLTAFGAWKAGMTHVLRDLSKPGSRMNNKEIVEAVTILETPPMIGIGIVAYTRTPHGRRCLGTHWASYLSENIRRRFFSKWVKGKGVVVAKLSKSTERREAEKKKATAEKKEVDVLARFRKYGEIVRLICATQPHKVGLGQKKAHVIEIQINGGADVNAKIDFALGHMEQYITVDKVFRQNELVDTAGATKGHGFEGVTTRWGTTRLPRKTHKGLRKVGCIGAWHPSRVQWSVPRAGQDGYYHRTEKNKKIYRIGKGNDPKSGSTEHDATIKTINPLGGFPNYGWINEDFLIVKGTIVGPTTRFIQLRKTIVPVTKRFALEEVTLKWIDTASKLGNGRYQTPKEKYAIYGPTKKQKLNRLAQLAKRAVPKSGSLGPLNKSAPKDSVARREGKKLKPAKKTATPTTAKPAEKAAEKTA